jgi:hypothetical protein
VKKSQKVVRGNLNNQGERTMKLNLKKSSLAFLMIVGGFLGGWISSDSLPLLASGPKIEVDVTKQKYP